MSREDAASVAEDLKQIGSHIITKIEVKPEDSGESSILYVYSLLYTCLNYFINIEC